MSNYTEGIRRALGEGFFYSLNVKLRGLRGFSRRSPRT